MQAIADAEGAGITIEPWDYRYYAEKVRKAKYDLDSDEVKQYLELEKLREAMFFVAGELFGFDFRAEMDRGHGAGVPRGRPGVGGHRQGDYGRSHRPVVPGSVRPDRQAVRRLGHHLPQSHETFKRRADGAGAPTTRTSSKGAPGASRC